MLLAPVPLGIETLPVKLSVPALYMAPPLAAVLDCTVPAETVNVAPLFTYTPPPLEVAVLPVILRANMPLI